MKIWISGSSGMLGSSLYFLLKKKNIAVLGTTGKEVDITSIEDIENFVEGKQLTHIINCSAYTKVDEAERNEKLSFEVNAFGVKNLGKVSKRIGAKVIHFSTDYVFSGDQNVPYREEDTPSPSTTYGRSKLLGEELLLSETKDPCIIRTSWLFGFNGKNFVNKMLEKLRTKAEVRVVSDQLGRPTFCGDLAEATVALLPFSGIFHFANDRILSRYAFTKMIAEKLSFRESELSDPVGFSYKKKLLKTRIVPVSSTDYPTLAKRPLYSVLSTQKIENALKVKSPSLLDALQNYICQTPLDSFSL